MRRFWRGVLIISAIEAALVAALVAAPGGGHSPLFFTHLPALILVGVMDPRVGSCLPCAPRLWAIAIAAQTGLAMLRWMLVNRALSSRSRMKSP